MTKCSVIRGVVCFVPLASSYKSANVRIVSVVNHLQHLKAKERPIRTFFRTFFRSREEPTESSAPFVRAEKHVLWIVVFIRFVKYFEYIMKF